MDQKNTIVKCTANPNCLFNHNGVCDNYVITIGADGSCQEYVETEDVTIRPVLCEHCGHYEDHGLLQNPCNKHECYRHRKDNACVDFIAIRGQRAKGNLLEDGMVDPEIVDEVCQPFKIKIAELNKENKNKTIIKIPPMSKEDRAIMNDIGYVPPQYPNYEECWICQYGGGSNMYCSLSVIPMRGPDGKCGRFSRRAE